MKAYIVCIIAITLVGAASAAYCHGHPSPSAQPNMLPIMKQSPKLVKSCKNGKLFEAGQGDDTLPILHIYGTPYEMGFAMGTLMKERATDMLTRLWGYLEAQVEQAINGTVTWIPAPAVKLIADLGLDGALDLTMAATKPYTGDYFYEEIRGLADATGQSATRISQIHMIGELTKGACSMFGAAGSATPDGNLLQLRALDWDVDGPFKDYPQLTVYHPAGSNAFINVGWTGWVGSITGMSERQMAISEIGVSFPDDTFGSESRFGVPFTFLLRDILQFDQTYEDTITRIDKAHRTCDLILGVGDGKSNNFRGIQYSHSVANFFTWDDMLPRNDSWHPRIRDIVYYGMDWLCPGYNQVLSQQLSQWHGNITAENAIRHVTPIVQTGNLHIAYYDLHNMQLYVANARRSDVTTGGAYAFDRTFNQYDTRALFAEPEPSEQSHVIIHTPSKY
eukprot:TRINITY_DN135_c0_g1_i1.p1 TRINITY_DN135_c0_g1~~TRINITY_DN135_c0_g1_i1.p1  ORF type:complete len:449 (+),score=102.01 TRINITY_DN135_c0_g1_i1:33-1379(+)